MNLFMLGEAIQKTYENEGSSDALASILDEFTTLDVQRDFAKILNDIPIIANNFINDFFVMLEKTFSGYSKVDDRGIVDNPTIFLMYFRLQ